MPLQIMKLALSATTEITTSPALTKFFYVTGGEVAPGSTLTIDAAEFFDDFGDDVEALPELELNNSMYNVYVNGVLQLQSLTTYTPGATTVGSLEIDVPAGDQPIIPNSPVVLEIVNFTPTSDTTILT